MNEITIGDKTYISAKRAAEITGYARDYVGQLCREGHVDAKMVGRSWYVYEPAIRAHRFGPEALPEEKGAIESNEMAPAEPRSPQEDETAWQNPTYTSEKPELLPELDTSRLQELLPPAEETLTDMQAAWREWFEQRQTQLETPEIESPEVIDERNEEHEATQESVEASDESFAIPLHNLESKPEEAAPKSEAVEEEIVPIRTIQPQPPVYTSAVGAFHMDIAPAAQEGRIVSERIVHKPSQVKAEVRRAKVSRSNAPIIALLVGISLVSVTVAIIGTGFANRYLTTLPAKNNPVIDYLVGTRAINKP